MSKKAIASRQGEAIAFLRTELGLIVNPPEGLTLRDLLQRKNKLLLLQTIDITQAVLGGRRHRRRLLGRGIILELKKQNAYRDMGLFVALSFPSWDEKFDLKEKARWSDILKGCTDSVTVCESYSVNAYQRRDYYMAVTEVSPVPTSLRLLERNFSPLFDIDPLKLLSMVTVTADRFDQGTKGQHLSQRGAVLRAE